MPPFCCGGGGLLRVTNPELSRAVLQKKLESLEPSAEIITCCPSCREQLGMERLRVRDIVEIVAESLGINLEG
jgi:Fe-S oxidoreductase